MLLEIYRKYLKVRKIFLKNYRDQKIEIFGDNRKFFNVEFKVDVEDKLIILFLLDSKFFSEIDCNDYLDLIVVQIVFRLYQLFQIINCIGFQLLNFEISNVNKIWCLNSCCVKLSYRMYMLLQVIVINFK